MRHPLHVIVALRRVLARGDRPALRRRGREDKNKIPTTEIALASALDDNRTLPAWIDEVLKKAVHPDPTRRSKEPSEFAFALRHPDKDALNIASAPLIDRNPLLFWKGLCALLVLAIMVLLFIQAGHRP